MLHRTYAKTNTICYIGPVISFSGSHSHSLTSLTMKICMRSSEAKAMIYMQCLVKFKFFM